MFCRVSSKKIYHIIKQSENKDIVTELDLKDHFII